MSMDKWLYVAIGCVGLAAHPGRANADAPVRDLDERTLQEKYHIAPTEEGLIGALQHREGLVRSFAALKLAENRDKNAIAPILAALAAESQEGTRIILATAAAQLGADEGLNALRSMCEDRSWSPTLRMGAAQSMVSFLGRQDCLSDVLEVLRSEPDDHQASFGALNLLTYSWLKQAPPGQLDEIRALAALYLKSPDSMLRIAAGACIRDHGGPSAITQLRAAIDVEQESAVRESLEKDVLSVRQ